MIGLVVAAFAIVTNGQFAARVQYTANCSSLERTAGEEFRRYVAKMSGTGLPSTAEPDVFAVRRKRGGRMIGGQAVWFVTLEHGRHLLPARAVEALEKTDNPDAFVLATGTGWQGERALFVAGRRPIGVVYGAYALLEDYLGCGFYHPCEFGEVVPRTKDITVGDIFDFREPWIRIRQLNHWSGSAAPVPMKDMLAWETRRTWQWADNSGSSMFNGLDGFSEESRCFAELGNLPLTAGGHLFAEDVAPSSLFGEHPEFFPLLKGKRTPGDNNTVRRCYSNPEFIRRAIEWCVRFIDGGGRTIQFGLTDISGGWCECDGCRRFGTDKNGVYSLNNVVYRFFTTVGNSVLKARPHACIEFGSYRDYREPPTMEMTALPGTRFELSPHQRCYAHAFADPNAECNRHFRDLFEKFATWTPTTSIFDYYCYSDAQYVPLEFILGEDMRYYRSHNLVRWLEDSSCRAGGLPYSLINWQFYYIASRLAWDDKIDVAAAMETAYRRYYGAAAEPMLKYHRLRRELWESTPGHTFMGGGARQGLCLKTPGTRERLLGYLDAAEKAAGGDKEVLGRVAIDRQCLKKFWIDRYEKIKDSLKGSGKTVPVARCSGPIAVDGVLDEKTWRSAQQVSGFVTNDRKPPREPVTARVALDAENWYFGIEAFGKNPRTKQTKRDGQIWLDDSVEVAIANPRGEYFHFVINSAGVMYDAEAMGAGFESGAKVATRRADDRYTVELAIPIRALKGGEVRPGDDWRINICRSLAEAGGGDYEREGCSIDAIGAHEPLKFRRASFGANRIHNGNFESVKDGQPEWWAARAGKISLAKGADGRSVLKFDNALVTTRHLLDLPMKDSRPFRFTGSVRARGKGTLLAYLDYFVLDAKAPGGRRSAKLPLGEFTLTDEMKPYAFGGELPIDAQSDLWLAAKDAEVESVELIEEQGVK